MEVKICTELLSISKRWVFNRHLIALLIASQMQPMHGDFGLNENTRAISVFQLQQLNREKEHIQQQFLSRWLDTRGINKVRHSKGRLMDGL